MSDPNTSTDNCVISMNRSLFKMARRRVLKKNNGRLITSASKHSQKQNKTEDSAQSHAHAAS